MASFPSSSSLAPTCKYSLTPNTFKFLKPISIFPFHTNTHSKHTPVLLLGASTNGNSKKTINFRNRRENNSGFSSLSDRDEKVESLENLVHGSSKKTVNLRNRRENDSGFRFPGDGDKKSESFKNLFRTDRKMENLKTRKENNPGFSFIGGKDEKVGSLKNLVRTDRGSSKRTVNLKSRAESNSAVRTLSDREEKAESLKNLVSALVKERMKKSNGDEKLVKSDSRDKEEGVNKGFRQKKEVGVRKFNNLSNGKSVEVEISDDVGKSGEDDDYDNAAKETREADGGRGKRRNRWIGEDNRDKKAGNNKDFRQRRQMGVGKFNKFSKNSKSVELEGLDGTDNIVDDVNCCDDIVKETSEEDDDRIDMPIGGDLVRKKRSRKKKDDSPEVQLRVALDMCSKRGDFLGAIKLYDSAREKGINLVQYHYTVLLYLCSSAAAGMVQPAKSGTGARTLNSLDVSNKDSTELDKDNDMDSENAGDAMMNNSQLDDRRIVERDLNSISRKDVVNTVVNETEKIKQNCNEMPPPEAQVLNNIKTEQNDSARTENGQSNEKDQPILLDEDIKNYALQKGFEIYKQMCLDEIPMNEAALTSVARMAMAMGDGDMAFNMVKQMKSSGINPRLRSYGPALATLSKSGDIKKAFEVEKHMLEHGVYPEEPELQALLEVSIGAGNSEKVYYLLHKLRTNVRKISPSTADLIEKWFKSKVASRIGKRKWDQSLIREAVKNGGGGWHGQGWLGKGKWNISRSFVGSDGSCNCCGEKLAIIDLDPIETENFAKSVASIAMRKEKNSSFQKFQKWLDYHGPFEAVVDGANAGLFSQQRFVPSKVSMVANGIRKLLPSKRWPLIILHNKRITGHKMDEPANRATVEKWRNADALYATPTGSNDDWYWLYAAIKFKCFIVTNDEMRDHTFQLLGNDFFPRWKERHQVRFNLSDDGPVFYMPPPCSVVIQESENGHWHFPIVSGDECEADRTWLCVTRANPKLATKSQDIQTNQDEAMLMQRGRNEVEVKTEPMERDDSTGKKHHEIYQNLRDIFSSSISPNQCTLLADLEAAENLRLNGEWHCLP